MASSLSISIWVILTILYHLSPSNAKQSPSNAKQSPSTNTFYPSRVKRRYDSPLMFIRPENEIPSPSTKNECFETKYFTQNIDHFNYNPESYQTFQQRYLINDTYWGGCQSKAPIFVYTGNEGDVEMFVENTGFMYEIAPQFKALIVFIEHRYYGKSVPFGGNISVAYSNTSTLGYLSSAQALADYAMLIVDLKKNLTAEGSPVIVLGGSYGGMLAAWFRLKYPHIAIGALASSAPIRQFENMVSQYSFTDIITNDYKSVSRSCYRAIKRSWYQIEQTAKKENGLELLRKSLKICDNHISVDSLHAWLQSAFIYMAMSDYPTPANFIKSLPAYPIKEMCKAIDDPKTGDDILAKLYGAANIYYNSTGKTTCFDLQDDSDPRNIDFPAWKWQCCTELVLPTDANRRDSIFPQSENDPEARRMSCNESYNGMVARPNWITTEYGGHDIKRILKGFASNIIFFNGLRDPWNGGGILENISDSLIAIVAKEGAHHVDLRSSCIDDPEWLKDVRKQEICIMRKWLTDYYCDSKITNPLL